MKNILVVVAVLGVGAYFMFGDSLSTQKADLGKVLERTQFALVEVQKALEEKKVEAVSEEHMVLLSTYMTRVMNTDPAVYPEPVGVKLLKDSSFEGFKDVNQNNVQDEGDSKLFKVEIDFEGQRLIASGPDGGGFTGMGLATGLVAGMLMGRLMGGQRAAGIRPGSMANRNVQSRASDARSRARSGGRFGGK